MGTMRLALDKSVYTREVILKTAFSFIDRVYLHISQDNSNWIISWTPKDGACIHSGEFENELIAQQLRLEIIEKTAEIRKLILARAFASTMLDIESEETPVLSDGTSCGNEQKSILKGWFDANDRV